MPTLHLMVGLPCAGKTTLARQLEQEYVALRLTPDEWHMPLFGLDVEEPEHEDRHFRSNRCYGALPPACWC
jgi:predicted kinase